MIRSERIPRGGHVLVVALLAAMIGSAFVFASVMAGDGGPTKGPVPDAAINDDGSVNAEMIPDFVPVLDRNGERAGWVSAQEAGLLPGYPPGDEAVTVYADDLTTVVGSLVPGRGFVPAGSSPEAIPTFRVITEAQ